MPDVMAEQGSKYFEQFMGGVSREQREWMENGVRQLRECRENGGPQAGGRGGAGMIAITERSVVGENKNNPMVSFYAAVLADEPGHVRKQAQSRKIPRIGSRSGSGAASRLDKLPAIVSLLAATTK